MYVIEQVIEDGHNRPEAEVVKALELFRARLSQLMRRRWVSAAEQEQILCALGWSDLS